MADRGPRIGLGSHQNLRGLGSMQAEAELEGQQTSGLAKALTSLGPTRRLLVRLTPSHSKRQAGSVRTWSGKQPLAHAQ